MRAGLAGAPPWDGLCRRPARLEMKTRLGLVQTWPCMINSVHTQHIIIHHVQCTRWCEAARGRRRRVGVRAAGELHWLGSGRWFDIARPGAPRSGCLKTQPSLRNTTGSKLQSKAGCGRVAAGGAHSHRRQKDGFIAHRLPTRPTLAIQRPRVYIRARWAQPSPLQVADLCPLCPVCFCRY